VRGFELAVDADLALVLAEPRFADGLAALSRANREHLARFDPWALGLADVAAARAALESGVQRFAAGAGVPVLAVVGGQVAGSLGLRLDGAGRSGSVGYWLGAAYTGRGLATRAVRALARHGFDELGLVRVEARVEVSNAASRAVLERVGFRREGVLRSAAVVDEVVVGDLEVWGLLPADLPADPPPAGT